MKRLLFRLLEGVLRKIDGDLLALSPDVLAILPVVRELCLFYDQHVDASTSGEYKRAQVYGKLIKLYPKTPKHDLALAIEVAICLLRG